MPNVPSWSKSQKSHIWIFNVGRGLYIFVRTALNQGMIYDFGSSEDFKPTEFLEKHIIPYLSKYKNCNLAQTIISHPHADHITDIKCLMNTSYEKSQFYAFLHTCPHDKTDGSAKPEAVNFNRIKNPKGSEENINIYKSLYKNRRLPLQTICYDSTISIPNLEYGIYYVRPPVVNEIYPDNDQEYGNGLSIVFFYRHGFHTLLVPGDINPEPLKYLLDEDEGLEKRYTIFDRRQATLHPNWHDTSSDQPSLKSLLSKHGLSILVAPHHGLESGFSEDLYNSLKDGKPGLVVLSEKRHLSDTDGKVKSFYRTSDGAKGQKVFVDGKQEVRYSVSTINGHHILILFQGTGGVPEVYLEKNPETLLKYLK
ncbi:MAG: hypothetical protein HPY60_11475 [Candidatus Methanofastidiosum sp.]|nr:hypothetical protein [Methanofastidiosum sp.]